MGSANVSFSPGIHISACDIQSWYVFKANGHSLIPLDPQVVQWFWPFAATPHHSTGLEYEVNGFEGTSFSPLPLAPLFSLPSH